MSFIEVHVKGRIDPHMSDWFQGCEIEAVSPDESCLTGEAVDNSAIYGLLSTLSSLGIALISVSVTDTKDKNVNTYLERQQGSSDQH